MVLWYYGTMGIMVLCYYGTMVLWYYGIMVLWYYGTMVLGTMVLWYYGTMVLWYYGTMVLCTMVLWYYPGEDVSRGGCPGEDVSRGGCIPGKGGCIFKVDLVLVVQRWILFKVDLVQGGSCSRYYGT